jgi:PAS domain S-box-containing protein
LWPSFFFSLFPRFGSQMSLAKPSLTVLSHFVHKMVWPDEARGFVTRYGLAVSLPLASVAITHALFPLDRSPFSPLLVLSIVCAAMFGGIRAGVVSTVLSLALNVLALRPALSLRGSDPRDLLNGFAFVIAGVLISLVAGSVAVERRRLEATLSCIGDAVISTDLNGRILFMNAAAQAATGWSSAKARGRRSEEIFRIVNQDTRLCVDSPILTAIASGKETCLAANTLLLRPDGTQIPVSDSVAPIRDTQGKMIGAIMVFRDISEHQKREAGWLQTQRLISVGRLAATIAHELNNPLQSISNFLFLIAKADSPKEMQHYAVQASGELLRVSEMAQQTLPSLRSVGERSSVSIGQLFDEVLSLNQNKLNNKRIEVMRRYSSETNVDARASEIRQVLRNLVGNALDALEVNGTLHLRAKPMELSGRTVVQFVVADDGSGISKEHQAKVFEPFFTTKKDVGTGLGLWVVKKIIDNEGGRVHIRSKVGKGTVARFSFPSSPEFQNSRSL